MFYTFLFDPSSTKTKKSHFKKGSQDWLPVVFLSAIFNLFCLKNSHHSQGGLNFSTQILIVINKIFSLGNGGQCKLPHGASLDLKWMEADLGIMKVKGNSVMNVCLSS